MTMSSSSGGGGALSTSAPSSTSDNSSSGSSRYAVFDGSTDFQLWRARVENELLRFHLLGYIRVRNYDGSQAFEYNGEEVPPKCALVPAPTETTVVKDEPGADATGAVAASAAPVAGKKRSRSEPPMQQGKLTRLQVIAERAEAMGILQRYLHPEVERAILGKNIFDSWETLCGMYGNRNVSDFYKVHRLMHAMRLGEKDESAQDFITRLELMMEQYAQIAGIQLTDPFRSMLLAHALPTDWAPMLDVWKAFKPYIPYVQLVEKVVFEHSSRLVLKERDDALAKSKPTATETEKTSRKSSLSIDTKESSSAHKQSSSKSSPSTSAASTKEHSSSSKSTHDKAKTSRAGDRYDDKSESSRHKEKDDKRSSHYDKKDDRRSDKHYDSKRSDDRSYDKKREDDKRDDDRREYKKEDRRDKDYYHSSSSTATSYDKRDSNYSSSSSSYRDKRDYNSSSNGTQEKRMICFYCLKVGHCFQACWFLRVDVENDSYANNHKKYSATVTNDRTPYMVQRIEQYVKEMRRERGEKPISELAQPSPRGYVDHHAMRSKSSFREESTFSYGRSNHEPSHHESHAPEVPRTSYSQIASMRSQSMFRETIPHQQFDYDESTRIEPDVERYKKRSRSVFGDESALVETSQPHDPRSRSVFRQPETSGYRTADPSRRSVSPIPTNLHRSYSSNSNIF